MNNQNLNLIPPKVENTGVPPVTPPQAAAPAQDPALDLLPPGHLAPQDDTRAASDDADPRDLGFEATASNQPYYGNQDNHISKCVFVKNPLFPRVSIISPRPSTTG